MNTDINPYPIICNHCGSRVILCTNDVVYGRQYGWPWIYYCPDCHAYVGCHRGTKRALGTLANDLERRKRCRLHELFDSLWKGKKNSHYKRSRAYYELSRRLNVHEAHIGSMNGDMLNAAYVVINQMINDINKDPTIWDQWK